MVDLENIFGLFSHEDNDLSTGGESDYNDLKTSPMYYVGMYKKLILNHINFNKKVLNFFKNSNAELNVEDIKEAGEYVTYGRAWNYIKSVDLNEISHINALKYYSDEYLSTSLELGINYFQHQEEYERCAILLKILNKVKSFSSKVGDE
jgi:hypothetical protein|tara:strand:+ start:1620 stop:2066 length:447 start_codon:yes stop_codon:yes gene_type:complete